jgi:hypothetical protein
MTAMLLLREGLKLLDEQWVQGGYRQTPMAIEAEGLPGYGAQGLAGVISRRPDTFWN